MITIFFFVFDEEDDTTVSVPIDDSSIQDQEELEFIYDETIRKVWHKQEEEWYFSIVDVCQVLTDQKTYDDARNYWRVLKKRLKDEGFSVGYKL